MAQRGKVKKPASRGNLGQGPSPEALSAGGKQIRLQTVRNLRAFVAGILRVLRSGPKHPEWDETFLDRARASLYGAQILGRLIEGSEHEKRLAELERKLALVDSPPAKEGAELQ